MKPSNQNNELVDGISRDLEKHRREIDRIDEELLDLINRRLSIAKEIGKIMALSPRTIETHRKNMRRKLGIEKKKGNLRSHLLAFQ